MTGDADGSRECERGAKCEGEAAWLEEDRGSRLLSVSDTARLSGTRGGPTINQQSAGFFRMYFKRTTCGFLSRFSLGRAWSSTMRWRGGGGGGGGEMNGADRGFGREEGGAD